MKVAGMGKERKGGWKVMYVGEGIKRERGGRKVRYVGEVSVNSSFPDLDE